VEAKENFVWATSMEGHCDIFGIDNLGKNIAAEMTERLTEQQLTCFPDPLPSQQQKSALVMLAQGRFAKGFSLTPTDTDA
jgi:hypothetical protein